LRDALLNGRTVAGAAPISQAAADRAVVVVAPGDLRDLEGAPPDRPVTARPRARSRATT
jgi:hypothetical protein